VQGVSMSSFGGSRSSNSCSAPAMEGV
jgi:hypothetical protein